MARPADARESQGRPGYWSRPTGFEPLEVPDFSLSDDPTEESSVANSAMAHESRIVELDERLVVTEEGPGRALRALAPELPPARSRPDVLPLLDLDAPPYAARRAEELAAAIAADIDALEGQTEDEDATELHAAGIAVDSDAPTGQFESDDEWDSWEELEISEDEHHAPSLSLVREAPVGPEDEDYQDVLATPLPLPPRPTYGVSWPPPPSRPAVSTEPEYPSDWLVEDQIATIVLPASAVFRPRWSSVQLVLLNGTAWALGFMASFLTGTVVVWTTALVSFALTL